MHHQWTLWRRAFGQLASRHVAGTSARGQSGTVWTTKTPQQAEPCATFEEAGWTTTTSSMGATKLHRPVERGPTHRSRTRRRLVESPRTDERLARGLLAACAFGRPRPFRLACGRLRMATHTHPHTAGVLRALYFCVSHPKKHHSRSHTGPFDRPLHHTHDFLHLIQVGRIPY